MVCGAANDFRAVSDPIDIGQFRSAPNYLFFALMRHIRALPLLRNITQASLNELLRAGFLQQLHITLLNEGDLPNVLHAVVKGLVELFCNHAGRETTIDIIHPKAFSVSPRSFTTKSISVQRARWCRPKFS